MPTLQLEQLKSIPNSKLAKVIDEARERLKQDEVVQEMFDKFDVELDEVDYIPICFADLPVSARTEHGIIYLNYKLLEKGDFKDSDHYLVHEMTHYLQQTTGDGPTQGSNADDYLDNPYEQEGFQNQTKYISETKGDEEAEQYTEKVLDHHDVPEEEREERKEDLLQLASTLSTAKRRKEPTQLPLKFGPNKPEPKRLDADRATLLADFERAVAEGPKEPHTRPAIKKLHPAEQSYRMEQLRKLLDTLNVDVNEAHYFWDPTGKSNEESPSDRAFVDPNQTRFRFRDISKHVEVFAKKVNQLSPLEIEKLDRLKLGGDSEMTNFLDLLKRKVSKYPPRIMPIAIIAADKDTNNYVGWLLVRPHYMEDKQEFYLELDTFVDRAYRNEGVGSLLTQKLMQIRNTSYPNTEVEIGPWSPTASAFYTNTGMMGEDDYDRDVEEEEEEKVEVPENQLALPFKE